MSLPRYPEYKDSGVDWLGALPVHWAVTPIKLLGRLKGGAGFPHEEQGLQGEELEFFKVNSLASADIKGILQSCDHTISRETAARLGAFVFPARSVVFAKVGAALMIGRIRELPRDACLDNNMMGLVVSDENDVSFVRYAMELVRFDLIANPGAVPSLNEGQIGCFKLARPPRDEQDTICTFLDRETAKVDLLIAEQEKLLALLAEMRQATILRSVTCGVYEDKSSAYSGVLWMGSVPAHWSIAPLSRITVERCDGPFGSGIKSDHYTGVGALVVRLQNIRAGHFHKGESVFLDETYFLTELQRHSVVEGDLLVAGLGDENNLLGRACVAPPGLGPALVKADCFRFRLDPEAAIPEFIAWQLSAGASYDAGMLSTGTTRSRIPLSVMASRKIALPPLEEQKEIVEFIASQNAMFDSVKAEAESAIALLRERRAALISAAVTGKIDVRGLA